MGDQARDAIAERFRAIREATGLTQLQFLALLNAAAERAGVRPYVQSVLSRLENGGQQPTFDDVAIFAAVDPERRGKLWLAWDERIDTTLAQPRLGPSIIQEPDDAIFEEPKLPEKKPATKKRRA